MFTKTSKLNKFIFLFTIGIFFIACGSENSTKYNQTTSFSENLQNYVVPNMYYINSKFDYYEIKNNQIVATILNMEIVNVSNYFSLTYPNNENTIYNINKNYHIENNQLDINKTVDAMVFYNYDAFTKIRQTNVYIKDFGLYEIRKNMCTINTNENNCSSYLYVRY